MVRNKKKTPKPISLLKLKPKTKLAFPVMPNLKTDTTTTSLHSLQKMFTSAERDMNLFFELCNNEPRVKLANLH